ncbi:MAG TPA: IS66 family transposase [Gammaproteobacteria bacterium]|nr:IS66 family transposase [Gammaproteobacteria bacterium]
MFKKQLEWFKQQVFGQKTERRLIDIPAEQQHLFETEPVENTPDAQTQAVKYERKKPKQRGNAVTDAGLRFDDTVEVKEIHINAPELNGENADDYTVIDKRVVYRLAQRHSSYIVLKYIQPVVKHKDSASIRTKTAPTPVFEKSMADVSFLVGLLVDKFLYHQPLYRQHQKLALNGITLSRSSLTQYVHRTAQLLKPIYEALLRHILRSKVLAMDETPSKAGRKKKGKMQQAWFWPLLGDQGEIAFHFSPSRARKVVDELLCDFQGTLVTDGYAVYRAYAENNDKVILAQCWMHARRYFINAEAEAPEKVECALVFIRALYAHDETLKEKVCSKKGFTEKEQLAYRATYCKPVVDEFFQWCDEQIQDMTLLPKSLLAKALNYARNHETQLKVFLSDPHVPMDTGAIERALRVIPMGKKNWLFNWTEVGAEYTGIIQSLIVTCRMNGINPSVYLTDVLQRISQHPASQVDELTPVNWKEKYADSALKSDLECQGAIDVME